MSQYNRIEVSNLAGSAGYVTVVQVLERRLQDQAVIQELAAELDSLIADNKPRNVLVNLSSVEFVSSAALNRLITYNNRIKKQGGQLKLCNLRPQIAGVFAVMRLDKLFDIREDEAKAVAAYTR
jgi:anti-sigma B factor antagonist